MFCPNCGTKMNDDAMFCANCGYKIAVERNTSKAKNIKIIIPVFFIIIAVVGVLIFYKLNSNANVKDYFYYYVDENDTKTLHICNNEIPGKTKKVNLVNKTEHLYSTTEPLYILNLLAVNGEVDSGDYDKYCENDFDYSLGNADDYFNKLEPKGHEEIKKMENAIKQAETVYIDNIIKLKNYNFFFNSFHSLTNIVNSQNLDFSGAVSAKYMFNSCSSLQNIDSLSKWNVKNVRDMSSMFSNCNSLQNIDFLSKWNVKNVRDMSSMFSNCNSLQNIDSLNKWNVKNVRDMSGMFSDCSSLQNIDSLNKWNVKNVTNMSYMFGHCTSLQNVDFSNNWNVENVTNMSFMFNNCSSLQSIDLSKWNVKKLIDMSCMFCCCSLLQNINLNDWDVSNINNFSRAFFCCNPLLKITMNSEFKEDEALQYEDKNFVNKYKNNISEWIPPNYVHYEHAFSFSQELEDGFPEYAKIPLDTGDIFMIRESGGEVPIQYHIYEYINGQNNEVSFQAVNDSLYEKFDSSIGIVLETAGWLSAGYINDIVFYKNGGVYKNITKDQFAYEKYIVDTYKNIEWKDLDDKSLDVDYKEFVNQPSSNEVAGEDISFINKYKTIIDEWVEKYKDYEYRYNNNPDPFSAIFNSASFYYARVPLDTGDVLLIRFIQSGTELYIYDYINGQIMCMKDYFTQIFEGKYDENVGIIINNETGASAGSTVTLKWYKNGNYYKEIIADGTSPWSDDSDLSGIDRCIIDGVYTSDINAKLRFKNEAQLYNAYKDIEWKPIKNLDFDYENINGKLQIKNNKKYYIYDNGNYAKKMWVKIDNDNYYFDENGIMIVNDWIGDYYVDNNGKMVKRKWIQYKGAWYYLGDDGIYLINQWIDDYYVGINGKRVINAWIDGIYYVGNDGKYLRNTITPDGYYVDKDGKYEKDSSKLTGKLQGWIDGHYYKDGVMQKNCWIILGDDKYYLDVDGNVVKNKWVDGVYLSSDGKMLRYAMTPDGIFVNSDGKKVDLAEDINNINYDKVEANAWFRTENGIWYYFEEDRYTRKKGWHIDPRDNQTYYLDLDTGIMAVGWKMIDGNYYYFSEQETSPNWYLNVSTKEWESKRETVKSYGSMYSDEYTPDGKYVDKDGKLVQLGDNLINVLDLNTITGELQQIVNQSIAFDDMLQNATTQIEMNEIAKNQYLMWENEINSIWNRIKEVNNKEKQKLLLEEERQWIKDKDAKIKQAGNECSDGSIRPLVENTTATQITIERTYYLSKILADLLNEDIVLPDYKKN